MESAICAEPMYSPEDRAWDSFLLCSPLGEFQQSSAWARWKRLGGWIPARTLLKSDGRVVGGFQMLWRSTRFGRIGYVSRGPAVQPETDELTDNAITALVSKCKELDLTAVIVQPPADSRFGNLQLARHGFIKWPGTSIIGATLRIDVSQGERAILSGIRRTTLQQIRKAERDKITIRQGNLNDVGIFYDLMTETCRRQRSKPNPGSVEELRELCRGLELITPSRLTIAENDGQPVSGLFCILFGRTLTLWKKGSIPKALRLHSMELLYREAIFYAASHGFDVCDFVSLKRSIGESLLAGRKPTHDESRGRDVFNLGFGGYPVLLPDPMLLFNNRFVHHCFRIFHEMPILRQFAATIADRAYSP